MRSNDRRWWLVRRVDRPTDPPIRTRGDILGVNGPVVKPGTLGIATEDYGDGQYGVRWFARGTVPNMMLEARRDMSYYPGGFSGPIRGVDVEFLGEVTLPADLDPGVAEERDRLAGELGAARQEIAGLQAAVVASGELLREEHAKQAGPTLIPPPVPDGRRPPPRGSTKIRIRCDGGAGPGSKHIELEDGTPIKGVQRVDFEPLTLHAPVRATITVHPKVDLTAELVAVVQEPQKWRDLVGALMRLEGPAMIREADAAWKNGVKRRAALHEMRAAALYLLDELDELRRTGGRDA